MYWHMVMAFWFSLIVYVIICGLGLIALLLLVRLDVGPWPRAASPWLLGLGLGC